jgi:rod shape-determining protein MreC
MRLQRQSPYRSLTLVIALIVLALLLLLLDQSGRLGSVRAQVGSFISPALTGLARFGSSVSGVGQELSEVPQLRQEVDRLREENSRLKNEIIAVQAVQQENERLRTQLQIQKEQPWKLLGAEVAALTPDSGRHIVHIAAGEKQGVRPGMAVIGREGSSPAALIGVIDEVGANSSTVLLITDFSSVLSARVYHQDQVLDGVVQGQWQRGSRLQLAQVPRSVPLAEGDVVMTAGLTADAGLDLPRAAIPRNVPIGTVETVSTDGYNQSAAVRPYIDPDQVNYAWVLINHGD